MLPGKVLITFDTWTSRAFDPYIAITAHYINSSTNSQSLWVLKKDLIGFFPVIGSHSGENLACYIIECVEWFGLEKKVRKKNFYFYTIFLILNLALIQLSCAMSNNASNNHHSQLKVQPH